MNIASKNLCRHALCATIVIAAGSAGIARATITGYTDVTGANEAVVVSGGGIPNPVTQNPNDGRLVGWDELQNVTLTADLRVDRVFDTNASFVSVAPGGDYYINAGTVVSSHYFVDPEKAWIQATLGSIAMG